MAGLVGKKIGMSNIFGSDGARIPVTIIEAGPCKVMNVKTPERDGYSALQLGFGSKKEKHMRKPQLESLKKLKLKPTALMKEFKFDTAADYKIGDDITVELFKEGEKIKVRGKSIGKGFQGVMKRHGFGGVGGTTHGQSNRLRAPGSIGQSSDPSKVFKGTRMAGRTGGKNVTVRNLKVVKVIPEKNVILVKGAVPGKKNTILELYKS